VLISLSLIGLILIQVSWINNMVLLRQEQIKHSVEEATKMVGNELAQHKGGFSPGNVKKGLLSDEFSLDIFKPITIGQRFNLEDIRNKIKRTFLLYKLKNIPFEFGIASFDKFDTNVFEIVTPNCAIALEYTRNNLSVNWRLEAFSGTAGENLTVSEGLFVVIPNIKSLVLKDLRWRIVTSVLFTIIILAAFYLTVRTMLRQKKPGKINADFTNNITP